MAARKNMPCEQCDNSYILNNLLCVCTKHESKPSIRRDTVLDCDDFKPRLCSSQVPRLVDEIASHFAEEDHDLILLSDGNPLFTISKKQTINEVELLLRVYCIGDHKYSIIDGDCNDVIN